MIRYDLKCRNGHSFDAWFGSSSGFDTQRAAGRIACTVCGSTDVDKALMAPSRAGTAQDTAQVDAELARLRAHIEANSEDVGSRFASEARAMHLGDAPERQIHGQAKPEEARALIEDGIPVAPLPFIPKSRTN